MKKKASIIIGIVTCIIIIVIAYFWATALIDSMYAYRSPLQNSPPAPGEAIGKPITRSVVLVLIDALRYDTSMKSEVMPYLNQLRSRGASAMMHSRTPSYSEPGYTVLLTGAWPDISDGPALNLDYEDIPTFTQDNIYAAAHRADLLTAISAFNWFEKLVPQNAVTVSFYTAGEDQVADREVIDAALPWLAEGKYSLVLIHIDQVDYAGHHEGGPIDPRWDEAALRADGLLEEIAAAMDFSKDTLLIFSDHGQIDQGGHGGQDPIVLLEPFVMAGKGVIPGDYGNIDMVDVAPTIAAILGTSIPATNQGKPRVEMLDIPLDQISQINQLISVQQGKLATLYGEAIGQPVIPQGSSNVVDATQKGMAEAREARLNNERLPRGIVSILIIIMIVNLVAWRSKPHFSWFIAGVLIYLSVFNIKYIIFDHKTYSLSSVSDPINLILSTGLTTFIALVVAWLFMLLITKSYRLRPHQAANTSMNFILTTLAFIAIPVLIHFFYNGATVTWTLPDFLLSFLGLLFLVQLLMVSFFGLILVGISALIGYFAPRNY